MYFLTGPRLPGQMGDGRQKGTCLVVTCFGQISLDFIAISEFPVLPSNSPSAVTTNCDLDPSCQAAELLAFKASSPGALLYWLGMPAFPHPPIDSRRNNQRLLHMVCARTSTHALGHVGVAPIGRIAVMQDCTHANG